MLPCSYTVSRYLLPMFPCSYVKLPPAHVSMFIYQVTSSNVSMFICQFTSCPCFYIHMSSYFLPMFPGSYVKLPLAHVSRSLCLLSRYLPAHVPGSCVQGTPAHVSRFLCPGNSCPCFYFMFLVGNSCPCLQVSKPDTSWLCFLVPMSSLLLLLCPRPHAGTSWPCFQVPLFR